MYPAQLALVAVSQPAGELTGGALGRAVGGVVGVVIGAFDGSAAGLFVDEATTGEVGVLHELRKMRISPKKSIPVNGWHKSLCD